jgi:predicted transposase YbfD/YdcC
VFRLLGPAPFGRIFEAFLTDFGADGAGVIAIDGKTLRRPFDRAAGRSALHVVTAFGTQARVGVGQRAVGPGENEVTAGRALLATLSLDGALVTGDAVHAQAETAELVLDRGGDYLFALRANRRAMLSEVAAFFADHDRVETRRHRPATTSPPRGPPQAPSPQPSAPTGPSRTARVLDVTFDEDAAQNRVGNGPRTSTPHPQPTARRKAEARRFRKRERSAWPDDFARTIIGQMR